MNYRILEELLEDNHINALACRVLKNDSTIYTNTFNNRHDVTIDYQGKTETFTVYTGQGWGMISGVHALRLVLDHIEEVSGSPTLEYWLIQCGGEDMLKSVVEEMPEKEARALKQTYFDYCHDLETRFLALVGEDLFSQFMEER